MRLLLIFSALLVASFLWAQDTKTAPPSKTPDSQSAAKPAYDPVPVAASHEPNPVKATSESIAAGKKIYTYDCALCHGERGDGKGDASMKVPDLTDPATLKDATDGEVFYRIKKGHGDMPPEGDRVKNEQMWNLVNYVRSLNKKKGAEAAPAAQEKAPEEKAPEQKPPETSN